MLLCVRPSSADWRAGRGDGPAPAVSGTGSGDSRALARAVHGGGGKTRAGRSGGQCGAWGILAVFPASAGLPVCEKTAACARGGKDRPPWRAACHPVPASHLQRRRRQPGASGSATAMRRAGLRPCRGVPQEPARPPSAWRPAGSFQNMVLLCAPIKNGEKRKKKLASRGRILYTHFRAEVVELVDTLGSGSSSGNGVGVRLSPSAPMESKAGSNTSLFLFPGPGSFHAGHG